MFSTVPGNNDVFFFLLASDAWPAPRHSPSCSPIIWKVPIGQRAENIENNVDFSIRIAFSEKVAGEDGFRQGHHDSRLTRDQRNIRIDDCNNNILDVPVSGKYPSNLNCLNF